MKQKDIEEIAGHVAAAFRTFGGGKVTFGNPISHALRDEPPAFAAGVSVRDVVEFVLKGQEAIQRRDKKKCRT